MSEVAHLVAFAQHFLQANRVGIVLAVLQAIAISYAIAHTSHLDLPKSLSYNAKAQSRRKE